VQDFAGKVAVITGAASGIGWGVSRACMRAGMAVAMCDIRADKLKQAVEEVKPLGQGRVLGIVADVSKRESVEQAAEQIEREFGKIHFVHNNAGVVLRGLLMEEVTDEAWNWVLGVNLYGVIHGIQAFVPRIKRHGEGGHVVNTASMAGLQVGDRKTGVYAASKFAVVALSDALQRDLKDTNIGVSVLTPAAVSTEIYASSTANRPSLKDANPFADTPADIAGGLHPDEVGRRVLDGVRAGQFYLITHPETRSWIEQRHQRIMDAYDYAEKWERENQRG
jgi:NAD(P)-dependent dehydrogenase (short-subunit alcohol dehydrogenase family)